MFDINDITSNVGRYVVKKMNDGWIRVVDKKGTVLCSSKVPRDCFIFNEEAGQIQQTKDFEIRNIITPGIAERVEFIDELGDRIIDDDILRFYQRHSPIDLSFGDSLELCKTSNLPKELVAVSNLLRDLDNSHIEEMVASFMTNKAEHFYIGAKTLSGKTVKSIKSINFLGQDFLEVTYSNGSVRRINGQVVMDVDMDTSKGEQ